MVAHLLAPLIGGIIAARSFTLLYIVGAVTMVVGTAPLFLTKDQYPGFSFNAGDLFSVSKTGTLISFGSYAIESSIGRILWPIFVVMTVISVQTTGFLTTVSLIASLFVIYVSGRLTDNIDRLKLLRISSIFYSVGWLGRLFANSSFKIFLIDSYKNASEVLLQIPWSAHSYDLAKKKNYFSFIVGREIWYNITRVLFFPLLILVFIYSSNPFMISFFIAAVVSLGYGLIKKK